MKAAIEGLFAREHGDMLLVSYVAGNTKNLTAEEIRGSLARCQATFDFPIDAEALPAPKAKKARANGKATAGTANLADLIAAGVLKPPVQLMRTYKGKELSATVLPTGMVRVGKVDHASPSMAAVAAIGGITGKKQPTNGWDFWQVPMPDGKRVPLATFRSEAGSRSRATGS